MGGFIRCWAVSTARVSRVVFARCVALEAWQRHGVRYGRPKVARVTEFWAIPQPWQQAQLQVSRLGACLICVSRWLRASVRWSLERYRPRQCSPEDQVRKRCNQFRSFQRLRCTSLLCALCLLPSFQSCLLKNTACGSRPGCGTASRPFRQASLCHGSSNNSSSNAEGRPGNDTEHVCGLATCALHF